MRISSMFDTNKYLSHGQRRIYNKINEFLCKLTRGDFENAPSLRNISIAFLSSISHSKELQF